MDRKREKPPLILYNDYLKKKFAGKVYKIALDAGFSCPGRCIYCNNSGSRASYVNPKDSVTKQLRTWMKYLREKKDAKKFIAYFQAFTNTYAPVDKLREIYDEVRGFDDIVGISIGTRPDAVDIDKLKLIASYKERYDVWLEYGLPSIHDKTLKLINRGHTFDLFLNTLKITRAFDIPVSVHVILGLPGETKEDMMATARRLSELKIDGIKIHLLHVLKGSKLEELYSEGKIRMLEQDEYVELVCEFLKNMPHNVIVQRLTAEGDKDNHIAPLWALDKVGTLNRIKNAISSSRLL